MLFSVVFVVFVVAVCLKMGNSESRGLIIQRISNLFEPNIELCQLSGGTSSWEGGLWDCVCGDPRQGRAEGGHQARGQGQDQGVGQGKRRKRRRKIGRNLFTISLTSPPPGLDQKHLQGEVEGKTEGQRSSFSS